MATSKKRATMRAIQYSAYGGGSAALKHVEVPVPSLKKDEVLIKVKAASINPADWIIQNGFLRPFLPRFPFTPAGGLAEYVAASESEAAACPTGISAVDAAGLPLAGLTALQALKTIGTKFDGTGGGASVLITAASGGVGTYAVQLAKLGNHHVTATCGARNLELVLGLGADEALDYTTPEGAALRNKSGREYDYIINATNDGRWSVFRPALSSRGRVVDLAPCCENYVASVTTLFSRKKIAQMVMSLGKEDLRFLLELMAEGKIRTVADSRHPFEKAAEAWQRSMDGHATGKIIIEM
ncbi:hypothetical protein ACP70R_009479 [Stipagrostis hirtigluma subsp. patula]